MAKDLAHFINYMWGCVCVFIINLEAFSFEMPFVALDTSYWSTDIQTTQF